MKRFLEHMKKDDFLFFRGDEEEFERQIPRIELPAGIKSGDLNHFNILIDHRLQKEISDFCRMQVKSLYDRKIGIGTQKFQETIKNRFLNFIQKYPEWFSIFAMEHLILFRESIYKHNIEMQKSKKDISPIERKSIRFQTGLSISRIFESIFTYQLPYFIKNLDFSDYLRLFNPIFLSGSFPEYFLSDFFCYLGIKTPVWNKERFEFYRDLLLDSSKQGLKSIIGVSLTSRGVALQKIFRVIKSKYSDFSEETADEIVEKTLDEANIFKELYKYREFKKQFLTEDIPKNMPKQDFLDRLLEEFEICASRFPLSKFFRLATDAEILRKITNNIILLDQREHPQGFDELLKDYTIYMITPPFIFNPALMKKKEKSIKKAESTSPEPSPAEKQTESEFDMEETLLVDVDIRELREKLTESLEKEVPSAVAQDNIFESSQQTDDQSSTAENEGSRFDQVDSLAEDETTISESNENLKASKPSSDNAKDETGKVVSSNLDPVKIVPKNPYLFGRIKTPEQGDVYLHEANNGPNYIVSSTIPNKASFKIDFASGKVRFFAKKNSNWNNPSQLVEVSSGCWEATIQRKEDKQLFHFYLEDIEKVPQAERKEPLEHVANIEDQLEESSAAAPINVDHEYSEMSVAELSQALLDGLIDIDQYNTILATRKESPPLQTLEEPDFVLEDGITYCNIWQGRILTCDENEAEIKLSLSGNKFQLEILESSVWKSVFRDVEITKDGFKGSFKKTIVFSDPTGPDQQEKVQHIVKDFSFSIFLLISNNFGIKFL